MIASPLNLHLIEFYATNTSTGVAETFLIVGLLYLGLILFGSCIVRKPREGW